MKIALLGATGPTGQAFMSMALEAGHDIRALVRSKAKLSSIMEHANLSAIQGDATDAETVTAVVHGADVVVSCLGFVPGSKSPMSEAFRHILAAAAQEATPPRCILMTTIGVGGTSLHVKFVLSTLVAGRKAIADYEKADALVRKEHGPVPYVLVRPGHLTNGPFTGKYHVSLKGKYHIAMKIARADVANFILRTLTSDEHDNQPVMLYA